MVARVHRVRLLLVFLGVVIAAWLGYRFIVPRGIGEDSKDALFAVWNRDGKRLFSLTDPGEIQALNLSPAKVQAILDEIVWPRLHQCRDFTYMRTYVNGNPGGAFPAQGISKARLTLPAGDTVELCGIASATDSGGKVWVEDKIMFAWWVDYLIRHPLIPRDPSVSRLSQIEGCARDAAILKRIGIPGLYDGMTGKLIPWDEYVDGLRKKLSDPPHA